MARDNGISEDEIGAVQAVVMAVSAGRVNAQFRAAEKKVGEARQGTCAC